MAVEEEKTVQLPIRNYTDKACTFRPKIEMHGCSGPEKISINGFGSDSYNMLVKPTLGGKPHYYFLL